MWEFKGVKGSYREVKGQMSKDSILKTVVSQLPERPKGVITSLNSINSHTYET